MPASCGFRRLRLCLLQVLGLSNRVFANTIAPKVRLEANPMKNTILALIAVLAFGQSVMAENAQPSPAPAPVPSVGSKIEAPQSGQTEKKDEKEQAKQPEQKEGAAH
jgi:hypothetical protein